MTPSPAPRTKKSMRMSRVLVTGGAGFIGSHLVDSLLSRGHRVTVLDDLSGGSVENLPADAEFVHGSITDVGLVQDLFESRRFEYVFHLAAYAAEALSSFIKRFNYTNNLLGSVTLINAAVNTDVKCFVFTSSIAVYGAPAELPLTEQVPPRPVDSYGIAKLAVEQELRVSRELFGMDYIVFRPHNVYGERQNIGDRYRNVIGIFMNQILQGKPMPVFGNGEQTRAFSYIGDVAPIIAESVEFPDARNQIFNIGADRPVSVNDLADAVARAMHVAPNISREAARHEVVHAYASHQKLERIFGERPHTSLEDGLSRMAAWVRRHGARESRAFDGIEVLKGLPAAWLDFGSGRPTA